MKRSTSGCSSVQLFFWPWRTVLKTRDGLRTQGRISPSRALSQLNKAIETHGQELTPATPEAAEPIFDIHEIAAWAAEQSRRLDAVEAPIDKDDRWALVPDAEESQIEGKEVCHA